MDDPQHFPGDMFSFQAVTSQTRPQGALITSNPLCFLTEMNNSVALEIKLHEHASVLIWLNAAADSLRTQALSTPPNVQLDWCNFQAGNSKLHKKKKSPVKKKSHFICLKEETAAANNPQLRPPARDALMLYIEEVIYSHTSALFPFYL